jgi:hypothetical protein
MLAFASVFVTRYRLLLFPALAVLGFVAYTIRRSSSSSSNIIYTTRDLASPFLIGTGLIVMYLASVGSWSRVVVDAVETGNNTTTTAISFWWYWLGETLVIFMFTYNSLNPSYQAMPAVVGGCGRLWHTGGTVVSWQILELCHGIGTRVVCGVVHCRFLSRV